MRHTPGPLGLVGRIFAILLMTVAIEFALGTLFYERASHLSLQEDEARRLAEHLVISRKLVAERPWREREGMARQLTTDRYEIRWSPALPPPPRLAPQLKRMSDQVTAWEPVLQKTNLRLRLVSTGSRTTVSGGLQLPDETWLYFGMKDLTGGWALTAGRIGLMMIPAVALVLLAGLLIGRTLSPLRHLAKATEQIGLDSHMEIEEAGTFEVRNLIRAFNAMQRRIRRLIDDRTETLAAVGHDLRTPIARLKLRLESSLDDEQREAMASDVEEMSAMVTSLLAYLGGEKDPEAPQVIDVAVMAATIADEWSDRGRDAYYHGPDHLSWSLRALATRRALGNLVENALHYGTRVDITVAQVAERLLIRVEDDGPGIPADRLEEVLRPFTRLDAARARNTKGLGLGLAIVARTMEQAGGTLRLANRPGGGLRAEMSLPPGPTSASHVSLQERHTPLIRGA